MLDMFINLLCKFAIYTIWRNFKRPVSIWKFLRRNYTKHSSLHTKKEKFFTINRSATKLPHRTLKKLKIAEKIKNC